MSTTDVRHHVATQDGGGLRVSAYDRVASLLIAMLVLVGLAAAGLFIIWLTSRVFPTVAAVPFELWEGPGGFEDGVVGESLQIESPNISEIVRETDLEIPDVQKMLELVVDVAAVVQVDITDPAETKPIEESGGGRSVGDGTQLGYGRGLGSSGFPPHERWIIEFAEGETLASYARQLDFFKIELSAVGNFSRIQYAYNLSKPRPDVRAAQGEEKRLHFIWQAGPLQDADRKLLDLAGINTAGKILVQFYEPETERMLTSLEAQYAGRNASQIRTTRFGVRQRGAGYEFYVIEQIPL